MQLNFCKYSQLLLVSALKLENVSVSYYIQVTIFLYYTSIFTYLCLRPSCGTALWNSWKAMQVLQNPWQRNGTVLSIALTPEKRCCSMVLQAVSTAPFSEGRFYSKLKTTDLPSSLSLGPTCSAG